MGPFTRSGSVTRRLKPRVFLFCPHPVAQQRFQHLLSRTGFDIVVSRELRLSGPEFQTPDVAQTGLAVIDGDDLRATLELVRTLRSKQNGLPLLVLLPTLEDSVAYSLLRLGVKGMLTYDQAPRALGRAVRQLAAGAYWLPRDLLTRFLESVLPELHGARSIDAAVAISRREREVLDLLLDNLSNKEIAGKLFVSERTVKFHVSNLLSKFHVPRRADLIVLWMQRSRTPPWPSHDLGQSISAHIN